MLPAIKKNWYLFWTWYHYDRCFDAPLEPFSLIQVSPRDIMAIKNSPSLENRAISGVIQGDWDDATVPLSQKSYFYNSLKNRVEDDVSWEHTAVYQHLITAVENNAWWITEPELVAVDEDLEEARSKYDLVIESLKRYEKLYYNIKNNGYMTQDELKTKKGSHSVSQAQKDIYKLNEVTVNVGRNGEIIWQDGLHRISIAHLLNLKEIPVRVRVRHHEWQKKRDHVYVSQCDSNNHPDLIPLQKKN